LQCCVRFGWLWDSNSQPTTHEASALTAQQLRHSN